MDPGRYDERKARMEDRLNRRQLADFEMGGGVGKGRSSYGGGANGLPKPPLLGMTQQNKSPLQRLPMGQPVPGQGVPRPPPGANINAPSMLGDMASINFGNAPSLGTDHANASARIQAGLGTVADFALVRRSQSPRSSQGFNDAGARQQYRSYLANPQTSGLVAAAQQALYG